ncbi:tight adherence protein C [Rhodovulum iodosum]|uniref:Tight adherence protein C n=1 Tax=Rhodovulum iodosum TaxID=68291 RepID=A0ABV3XY96_9RHOB|nr:type II secretion system F family protein [Rhodovulum robiginosum]RSK34205.1 type II secretion system F family protein [Rhodovulum robiginosum]
MYEDFVELLQSFELTPNTLALMGVGVGVLIIFYGLAGATAEPSPVTRRMRASRAKAAAGFDGQLIRAGDSTPSGLMKTVVPVSKERRSDIARKLAMAGKRGDHAVRNFFLVRSVLALCLPLLFIGFLLLNAAVDLPAPIAEFVSQIGRNDTLRILTVLVAAGFFAPSLWLKSRIEERQKAIRKAFPNTLDLLQVAVEAGLGFDAAMLRVAQEMSKTSPEISEEFIAAQQEINAGKERDRALRDMANRMGVEEVTAFVNVILQSMEFGTSVSRALTTYAAEMRLRRELRAQEKANRLPVQMSAVLATLMLPALLMISLTPTVIRYIRFFETY